MTFIYKYHLRMSQRAATRLTHFILFYTIMEYLYSRSYLYRTLCCIYILFVWILVYDIVWYCRMNYLRVECEQLDLTYQPLVSAATRWLSLTYFPLPLLAIIYLFVYYFNIPTGKQISVLRVSLITTKCQFSRSKIIWLEWNTLNTFTTCR